MAEKIVQLVDKDNNNLYPVAGSLKSGSVTTSTISDGAVTQSKIAYSSFSPNSVVTRFYFNTLRSEERGTLQAQTLRGTTLTFGWSGYGAVIGIIGGAENIKYANIIHSAEFSEGINDDYGVWGVNPNSSIYSYGRIGGYSGGENILPPGQASQYVIDGITVGYGSLFHSSAFAGMRDASTMAVQFIRGSGGVSSAGYLYGFAQSRGVGAAAQFSTELYIPQGFIPSVYQRGSNGKISSFYYIFEVYE